MPRNSLDDLRNHLFATLEDLRDDKDSNDKPIDADQLRLKVEKAKAVREISHAIIEAAKVEVEYAEVTGQVPGTDFFPEPKLSNGGRLLSGKTNGHA